MGFGKLAFMCSQNRHGEELYPCSLPARISAAEQEGALTKDSFPPGDQAQHLPRQYTEILQKWKGGSRRSFPLHKHRKFLLLLRQSHRTDREGKEDIHMGTKGPPSYSHRGPRKPYLLLLVTENILQSRLLESPPELWKAATWLHSSGQSQPEVGWQSLQPKKIKSWQLTNMNILHHKGHRNKTSASDCF